MTKQQTLATWTHPTTGELRVYVNDRDFPRGAKLFFFRGENEADPDFADFRLSGAHGLDARMMTEIAEGIGQECGGSWQRLLAMVDGQ